MPIDKSEPIKAMLIDTAGAGKRAVILAAMMDFDKVQRGHMQTPRAVGVGIFDRQTAAPVVILTLDAARLLIEQLVHAVDVGTVHDLALFPGGG